MSFIAWKHLPVDAAPVPDVRDAEVEEVAQFSAFLETAYSAPPDPIAVFTGAYF